MRKGTAVWLGVVIGGLLVLVGGSPAWAGPFADRQARKFGRGLMNIISCPAELMRVPTLVGRKEGTLAASSVGVVMGAWQMVARAAAGLYDVVTVPVDFVVKNKSESQSLIQPEFVWAHGDWAE